jgi:predicted peroxiredoxin
MKQVRRFGLASLALAFLLGPAGVAAAADAGAKDGLFVHLSHGADDPHRLLMALKMAAVVAESGRPVLVYCDIEAVKVLVKGAADVTHPAFPGAQAQLAKLLALGVRVRACPTCLKAAGLLPEQLRDGIALADRDEFFSFAGGRILTIDY